MITFTSKGDFKKANNFFERLKEILKIGILDKYGQKGIDALKNATPKDTGLAANSWYYEISHEKEGARLTFCNSDIEGGYNVAILIQYGHGNGDGGYVAGRDYINPAIAEIMDEILDGITREVRSL